VVFFLEFFEVGAFAPFTTDWLIQTPSPWKQGLFHETRVHKSVNPSKNKLRPSRLGSFDVAHCWAALVEMALFFTQNLIPSGGWKMPVHSKVLIRDLRAV
jgi:hypothetical protein